MKVISDTIKRLELDPEEHQAVGEHYENWDRALEAGKIFEVHAKRWDPRSQLNFTLMGLADEEVHDQALSKAYIWLLPRTICQGTDRIIDRARRAVKKRAHTIFCGHFILEELVPQVMEEIEKQIVAFNHYVEHEIITPLPTLRAQMEQSYQIIFSKSYELLTAQGAVEVDRHTFVNEAIDYVRRASRTEEEIRESHHLSYTIQHVPFQDEIAEHRLRAARYEKEALALETEVAAERQAILDRIEEKLEVQAAERFNTMMETLDQAENAILAEMVTSCERVAASLKAHDTMPGSSAKCLKNLVETIRCQQRQGLFTDGNLIRMIDEVEQQMALYKGSSSSEKKVRLGPLQVHLERMGQATRSFLSDNQAITTERRGIRRRITTRPKG